MKSIEIVSNRLDSIEMQRISRIRSEIGEIRYILVKFNWNLVRLVKFESKLVIFTPDFGRLIEIWSNQSNSNQNLVEFH